MDIVDRGGERSRGGVKMRRGLKEWPTITKWGTKQAPVLFLRWRAFPTYNLCIILYQSMHLPNPSHHSYSTRHFKRHYAYLKEALTHQETISVDDFFDWILYIRRDWGDTCCSRIDGVRMAREHETDLHRPFTELAHSLDKLGGDNIRFCRNDPIIVPGSNGSVTASEIGTRDSVDNLSKNRPFENVLHWMELLAFREFKLPLRNAPP
ncbi:hypothetical protein B0H13DRAFT_1869007 [Mycena leptocephala]|nr:hypothetical protein B0H13DRAFT_1869007 [Mycena leptocephala]